MKFEELSKAAQDIIINMVEYCLDENNGVPPNTIMPASTKQDILKYKVELNRAVDFYTNNDGLF
jgi:hypothetical protein